MPIINRNTIYDLSKDIINEILENTLFFITEMLTDEKEFDEAELIDELPGNESIPKGLNEHFQIDKKIQLILILIVISVQMIYFSIIALKKY